MTVQIDPISHCHDLIHGVGWVFIHVGQQRAGLGVGQTRQCLELGVWWGLIEEKGGRLNWKGP